MMWNDKMFSDVTLQAMNSHEFNPQIKVFFAICSQAYNSICSVSSAKSVGTSAEKSRKAKKAPCKDICVFWNLFRSQNMGKLDEKITELN